MRPVSSAGRSFENMKGNTSASAGPECTCVAQIATRARSIPCDFASAAATASVVSAPTPINSTVMSTAGLAAPAASPPPIASARAQSRVSARFASSARP